MDRLTITNGARVRHLDARALARHAGIHITSARRVLAGTMALRPQVWEVLQLRALGRLPFVGWEGFAFEDGRVITPAGDVRTPSELEHYGMMVTLARRIIEADRAEDRASATAAAAPLLRLADGP